MEKNVPSLSKRNKKDSFVSLSVSKPSASISTCGSRVSYGVSFIYIEHNFEMLTAAGPGCGRYGVRLKQRRYEKIKKIKKRLISKPFC